MLDAGVQGGMLFSLMDEWFKRAWVVERLEQPKEHRKRWLNAMSPEQNFGLVAMDPAGPGRRLVDGDVSEWTGEPLVASSESAIRALWVSQDEEALYLRLDIAKDRTDLSKTAYYVGIDTIRSDLGDVRFPDGIDATADVGMEFVLRLDGRDTSELLVDREYSPHGVWHAAFGFFDLQPYQLFRPIANDDGLYDPIRTITNIEITWNGLPFKPRLEQHSGLLRHGIANPDSPAFDSLADFFVNAEAGVIEVRLPWTLLNVSDPTERAVLFGNPNVDGYQNAVTDGFRFTVLAAERGEDEAPTVVGRLPAAGATETFTWSTWEQPAYKERLKRSFFIFQAGIADLLGE
jgi:hypothetical protein